MSDLANAEGIKVVLDKERTIRYDMFALYEIENKYGSYTEATKAVNSVILNILNEEESEYKLADFIDILMIGLLHEDKEVNESKDNILKSIDAGNFLEISNKTIEAFDILLPIKKLLKDEETEESEDDEIKN